jgi:hypothetical protein
MLGAEVIRLKANRLTGLGDSDPRRAYIDAKSTLTSSLLPLETTLAADPAKCRLAV